VSQGGEALDAVDRIIAHGGDADDVLREVVGALHERYDFVAVRFVEGDDLVTGPSLGMPGSDRGLVAPITFEAMKVAELEVSPATEEERDVLERVATKIAPYCLVGWDTGGERWAP
jgi:hypothetical protein